MFPIHIFHPLVHAGYHFVIKPVVKRGVRAVTESQKKNKKQ
jgi:hypothetical protein